VAPKVTEIGTPENLGLSQLWSSTSDIQTDTEAPQETSNIPLFWTQNHKVFNRPHHSRFIVEQCISKFDHLEGLQIKAYHKLNHTENLINSGKITLTNFNGIHQSLMVEGRKHANSSAELSKKIGILSKLTTTWLTQLIHNQVDQEHTRLIHSINNIPNEMLSMIHYEGGEAKELAFAYLHRTTQKIKKKHAKAVNTNRLSKQRKWEPTTDTICPSKVQSLFSNQSDTAYPCLTQLVKIPDSPEDISETSSSNMETIEHPLQTEGIQDAQGQSRCTPGSTVPPATRQRSYPCVTPSKYETGPPDYIHNTKETIQHSPAANIANNAQRQTNCTPEITNKAAGIHKVLNNIPNCIYNAANNHIETIEHSPQTETTENIQSENMQRQFKLAPASTNLPTTLQAGHNSIHYYIRPNRLITPHVDGITPSNTLGLKRTASNESLLTSTPKKAKSSLEIDLPPIREFDLSNLSTADHHRGSHNHSSMDKTMPDLVHNQSGLDMEGYITLEHNQDGTNHQGKYRTLLNHTFDQPSLISSSIGRDLITNRTSYRENLSNALTFSQALFNQSCPDIKQTVSKQNEDQLSHQISLINSCTTGGGPSKLTPPLYTPQSIENTGKDGTNTNLSTQTGGMPTTVKLGKIIPNDGTAPHHADNLCAQSTNSWDKIAPNTTNTSSNIALGQQPINELDCTHNTSSDSSASYVSLFDISGISNASEQQEIRTDHPDPQEPSLTTTLVPDQLKRSPEKQPQPDYPKDDKIYANTPKNVYIAKVNTHNSDRGKNNIATPHMLRFKEAVLALRLKRDEDIRIKREERNRVTLEPYHS
jgi:hypothetical protein